MNKKNIQGRQKNEQRFEGGKEARALYIQNECSRQRKQQDKSPER